MKTTLELYGAQTGDCIRAAITLEEAGLSYTPKLVDLSSGAQRGVDHLALNPAGKVPVLVEKEEDREPFILTQSNAIILYAAGKAAGRLPENDRDRAIVFERFFGSVANFLCGRGRPGMTNWFILPAHRTAALDAIYPSRATGPCGSCA